MRKSIIFFINYLNLYFLHFRDGAYAEYLKDYSDKLYKELMFKVSNADHGKYSAELSKNFLHWMLKRSPPDFTNMYYAIIQEKRQLCSDYRDCMKAPPSLDWQIVPRNLKAILDEPRQQRVDICQKKEDVEFKPTDLQQFIMEDD